MGNYITPQELHNPNFYDADEETEAPKGQAAALKAPSEGQRTQGAGSIETPCFSKEKKAFKGSDESFLIKWMQPPWKI